MAAALASAETPVLCSCCTNSFLGMDLVPDEQMLPAGELLPFDALHVLRLVRLSRPSVEEEALERDEDGEASDRRAAAAQPSVSLSLRKFPDSDAPTPPREASNVRPLRWAMATADTMSLGRAETFGAVLATFRERFLAAVFAT